MNIPVSSHCRGGLAGVSVHGVVSCGLGGAAVVPAAPDHQGPGAGENTNRMWMPHASGSGSGVEVGGPGVGMAGGVGGGGGCAAQLGVDLVAEADGAVFAGLVGERADAGGRGECL